MSNTTCECVSCSACGGSGNVWFTMGGRYLGQHRSDDLGQNEACDNCQGRGITEMCENCAEALYEEDAGEA